MIEVRHVSKYYGAHAAVRGLTFDVPQGEVVGLLGLNGAGKTTTLRLLSGLLAPTSGAVYVGGVNMADDPEGVRGRIGFLPERPPLYPEMTVRSYLRFVAKINGVRRGLQAALDAALTATDLLGVQHERIAMLSDGTQRRVGIAQTVVHSPNLILLDEPTQGLDPVQVAHMRRLIHGLRGRHTVLLSSHLLGEVHALCDRILVLDEGQLVAQGSEQALAAQVAGGPSLRLVVQGEVEALRAVLARFAPPEGIVVTPAIGDDGAATLQAEVQLGDAKAPAPGADARAALVAALVGEGLGVLTVQAVQLPLDALFLRLLGRAAEARPVAAAEAAC